MKSLIGKLVFLNLLIGGLALSSPAQTSAITVRVDTYRTADHQTLLTIKPLIMQSLQNQVAKVKLNESYERAYGRSADQLTFAEGRGNSSEIAYYKKNSEYYEDILKKDPRKIVIYYASPFKNFTALGGLLSLFGVKQSDEEKELIRQRHEREAGYQVAHAMGRALIEAVNADAGQVILSEKDIVIRNSSGAYNEVLVSIGSGQINK